MAIEWVTKFKTCPSTVLCTVPSSESPNFGGFPVENPTHKATAAKLFLRNISLSEYGSRGFQVRLRRLSEYGSVAYSVERPTWETQAEQYSDTLLTKFREN